MCRHLGYLGPPIPLSTVLFDPPHSLSRQSWAPKDMRQGGTINADGFGIGWYVGRGTAARVILAAVRSATIGMPVTETAAPPFSDGRFLFSHNGVVAGWPDSVAPLAARLPIRDLLTLDAPTDAALLWALVRHRLRDGAEPAKAVLDTVRDVAATAPGSRLNLLLTDGAGFVATTLGHALSVRRRPGEVLLSSEPLDDDPAWQPVPDARLVVATPSTVDISPLSDEMGAS